LLIHKLHAFFSPNLIYPDLLPSDLWLSYEGVPLKWHYPLGLLYDLYSGAEPAYPADSTSPPTKNDISSSTEEDAEHKPLPWRLTVHFSEYPTETLTRLDNAHKHMHDLYIHSVKEADYLRTGTGKTVMFLSKEDSTQLWDSVRSHDFATFNPINQKLLNPQGVNLRNLPVRLYLPHVKETSVEEEETKGSVRIVQCLVPAMMGSRESHPLPFPKYTYDATETDERKGQPQTVGTALNHILPTLFPSRRSPLLAQAVLHGAVVPLNTGVEELLRVAAYLDGWLHVVVVMMG
jgi:autophagy-related protein 5